jgi:hypothetical protein
MTMIAARQFRTMLAQVTPHMGSDDTLPVLTAIHLECGRGNLFAVATDQYTMGIARATVDSRDNWTGRIQREDMKTVTAWLRTAPETIEITGIRDGDTVTVTLAHDGSTLRLAAGAHGELPKWRDLVKGAVTAKAAAVDLNAFNTAFLARFKAAGTVLHTWQGGPGKPLLFTDAEATFVGIQMPVRTDERQVSRDSLAEKWTRHLPAAPADPVADAAAA